MLYITSFFLHATCYVSPLLLSPDFLSVLKDSAGFYWVEKLPSWKAYKYELGIHELDMCHFNNYNGPPKN